MTLKIGLIKQLTMRKLLLTFVVMMCSAFALMAQVTTSSMSGIVKNDTGLGVIGATVTAIHVPTGSKFVTTSRKDGRFNLPNVRVGGPYTIKVTMVGAKDESQSDVFVNLGEDKQVDFFISEKSQELAGVEVVGQKRTTGNEAGKTYATTVLDNTRLNSLVNVNRSIADLLKQTPVARIDNNGAISIAGQNNRFNNISINGAPANDNFGLAASGTNGGQASASPIPVDAIDQFQISTSPFDVRYNGFTGGAVNAVTKSGTNSFEGSASYFFRNQNLAGKTPTDNSTITPTKLSEFSNKTYAATLGGPIIKNKLFFFLSGEYQTSVTPQPFNLADYKGSYKQADFDNLANVLKTKYGYDPGGYLDNNRTFDRKALVAKLDWNISDKHSLSIFYNYLNAKSISSSRSTPNAINYYNGGVLYPNVTNQLTAELKSNFSSKLSNNFLAIYSNVQDDRSYLGNPFPNVQIFDPQGGSIYFGSEAFSSANKLSQKTFNVINETKLYTGNNTLSFIVDAEYNQYYNLFIRQSFGVYRYQNLDAFLKDAGPIYYTRSYSLLPGDISGDGSKAAADFKTYRVGAAIQDKLDVTDLLSLTFGVRADLIGYPTRPLTDNYFNNTAVPAISQHYDLQGARSGQLNSQYISLTPRISFNQRFDKKNSGQIRGGIGLFQGRLPAVWPGGIYTNNGLIIGGITRSVTSAQATAGQVVTANGAPLPFDGDPNKQYTAATFGATNKTPSGESNVLASNFALPKVAKFDLGVDFKLPGEIQASVGGNYTVNLNQVIYTNVNISPAGGTTTGPDARTYYNLGSAGAAQIPMTGGNPYSNNIYLMSNGGAAGSAYTFTSSLRKTFKFGLDMNVSYTYNQAFAVNDVTSSQNSSQWRYMESVNGKNNLPVSVSDFSLGHRITAFLGYSHDWFKFGGTTISFSYYGQSGNPLSFVYRNSIIGDDGASSSNDLIFIPNKASDLAFVPLKVGTVTYTPAEQAAAYDAFINSDKYLSENRGKFAARNASRTPFVNLVDLHFQQNFFVKSGTKKHNLAFSLDIQNLGNLINNKWGRVYYTSNDQVQGATFAGFQAGTKTPTFQFNPTVKSVKDLFFVNDISNYNSSRWNAQIGVKYFFK